MMENKPTIPRRGIKKRSFLLEILISFVVIFLIWVIYIFPCTKKQTEIIKHDLIEGIIMREIKLRELYAKANGKEFIQTKKFKQQIQKEREKFYSYCGDKELLKYHGKNCELNTDTTLFDGSRYVTYYLRYRFDDESQNFFNQVKIYFAYKRTFTNPTGKKKIWHDYFWIPHEKDKLLYQAKVTGFEAQYGFFGCDNRPEHHLLGDKLLELGSKTPEKKDSLIQVESKVYFDCSSLSISKDLQRILWFRDLKTYIRKEKK